MAEVPRKLTPIEYALEFSPYYNSVLLDKDKSECGYIDGNIWVTPVEVEINIKTRNWRLD